jgi:ribonuclease HI
MGRLVAARSLSRQGGFDPDAAEAIATLVATQTARELGIQRAWFEEDTKIVADAVNSMEADWSRIGHLVDDVRSELGKIYQWKMTYIPREHNRAAHVLARKAVSEEMDGMWLYSSPVWLKHTLVSEHKALLRECNS